MNSLIGKRKIRIAFAGTIIGVITFLILYGITPLSVTNDSWILQGYDELDILQHYAGWLHFRNSPWTFPLMQAETLAYPTGTIISFTDSIPLVALVFKLLTNLLPDTFQYFGIFTLMCYMLQGLFAALLAELFIDNEKYIAVAVPFFTFAPILMERAFRHTALGSQWLILAALFLYFGNRDKEKGVSVDIKFTLLTLLSIGIHPYFLPMVYGIYFFYIAERVWRNSFKFRYTVKRAAMLFISLMVTVAEGYVLGTLGVNEVRRWGYSIYSMNLNALWNPISVGGYKWSLFLAKQNQFSGQYDGFNYVGLGILFAAVRCAIYIISMFNMDKIKLFIKNYIGIIFLSLCFTAFAVTNVITFNSAAITIPIPEYLLNLCSIFRSSGRLFYPVYYLIILFVIVFIYNNLNIKNSRKMVVISLVLCLQLGDMMPVLLGKHLHFLNEPQLTIIDDSYLMERIKGKELVVSVLSADDFELVCFAGKNNVATNRSCANTGDYSRAFGMGAKEYEKIVNGEFEKDKLYVTTDPLAVAELKDVLASNTDATLYETGRFLFVIPN